MGLFETERIVAAHLPQRLAELLGEERLAERYAEERWNAEAESGGLRPPLHVTETCPPRTGRTGFFLRARGRGAPAAVD